MITIMKTDQETTVEVQALQKGCWVHLSNPDEAELREVTDFLRVDPDWVRAALDEEERARIETEDGDTLIIVDIPIVEAEGRSFVYSTMPLGIICTEDAIATVTLKSTPVINDFTEGRVKGFYTFKKSRFILQLLYKNAAKFLQYLRQIDKAGMRVQNELHKFMKNKDLIQLLGLEKSLVYFSTSLTGNQMVLDRMRKLDYIKKYQDDEDLLEDVIIENRQAIEMCNIYRDILSGTMDAFASVISNNLNMVMKRLASITIVLSIPTIIASIWGMNFASMPLADQPFGFWVVTGAALLLSGVVAWIMRIRKML